MEIQQQKTPFIRRVVTGHDEQDVAKVLHDGPATNAKFPSPGIAATLIWCSDQMPADIAKGEQIEDMGARILGAPPPEHGSRFVVIEFAANTPGLMHRTETLDYVIVLSGEINMETDTGSVTLKAGEVMVQRGTNHAWSNRTDKPARVAFVMLDAKPLGIGKPIVRGEQVK